MSRLRSILAVTAAVAVAFLSVVVPAAPAVAKPLNCADLAKLGLWNIPVGHPMYRVDLDGDKDGPDGVACEDASKPTATIPAPSPQSQASAKPSPAASASPGVAARDSLPITGPSLPIYIVGGGLLVAGAALLLGMRRKPLSFRA